MRYAILVVIMVILIGYMLVSCGTRFIGQTTEDDMWKGLAYVDKHKTDQ